MTVNEEIRLLTERVKKLEETVKILLNPPRYKVCYRLPISNLEIEVEEFDSREKAQLAALNLGYPYYVK